MIGFCTVFVTSIRPHPWPILAIWEGLSPLYTYSMTPHCLQQYSNPDNTFSILLDVRNILVLCWSVAKISKALLKDYILHCRDSYSNNPSTTLMLPRLTTSITNTWYSWGMHSMYQRPLPGSSLDIVRSSRIIRKGYFSRPQRDPVFSYAIIPLNFAV